MKTTKELKIWSLRMVLFTLKNYKDHETSRP